MKLPEAIREAVKTDNPVMACRIADILRFKCHMNYDQIYSFAAKHANVTKAQWESLMYEGDYLGA